jgi:hypothetical protein
MLAAADAVKHERQGRSKYSSDKHSHKDTGIEGIGGLLITDDFIAGCGLKMSCLRRD